MLQRSNLCQAIINDEDNFIAILLREDSVSLLCFIDCFLPFKLSAGQESARADSCGAH